MNAQQQTRWPAPAVTMLFTVMQVPMVRHLAHPLTGQPLCGAQGRWETWETPVDEFEPAAWHGCQNCGRTLGWLVEEGEQVPSPLAALRRLLDDPTFGPQELTTFLLQHGGRLTVEALPLLARHAPVTVWQEALALSAHGDQGLLIEAGIGGHLFPPSDLVVLATIGNDETTLHLACLEVPAAVEQTQAASPPLCCVITRNLGPYWDRALFHLQPL